MFLNRIAFDWYALRMVSEMDSYKTKLNDSYKIMELRNLT